MIPAYLSGGDGADVHLAQEPPPAPPPTLDEIDVTRHREITSKAVSAILLLILKWFKVSRRCLIIHNQLLTSSMSLPGKTS
jgi:hypothetical protein